MENFDYSRLHNNTSNQSVEKDTTTTTARTADRGHLRTIRDISNVEQCRSEKLRKPSVIRKYHSVYLKKYVWSKGVRHYRRYKKAFVIPVIHVSRRPDNPFNVKSVVANLRRKQMTSPSDKTSDNNEQSVGDELCYSDLEKRIAKTRNWEAIRYKYQLDYKERLKMEREEYLREYAEMKKMSQKQHNVEHMRPFHQNTDERSRKAPHSVIVSNDGTAIDPVHSNRNMGERPKNLVSSTKTQVATFNGVTSVPDESQKFYRRTEYDNSACKLVDSTEYYRNRDPVLKTELEQMRFTRNDRWKNIQSEVKLNTVVVDSDTAIVPPATVEHAMPKTSEDFDFSIPFNESNILVKVMAPDRKNPVDGTNQHRQPHSLLHDTLLYDTNNPESKPTQRIALDEETNTKHNRPAPGCKSEWLQYIQNLLNKTPQTAGQQVDKTQTSASTSKGYFDHRPIPKTTTIERPNVATVHHTTNTNSQLTKYPDRQSTVRVNVDRPVVSNPRLIRPKVVHPSPYYRSDFFRNNHLYNAPMEDPIVLNMPVRPHSPARMLRDQPNVPPHMEYSYANHPNYHDLIIRSMRVPFDVSHANLMGQPVYSPYDQTYMQYPIEMERMPPPPYIDPFVQHNNGPPPNRSIGFLPPRPTGASVYRYLNPQHDHPLWIYPHLLER